MGRAAKACGHASRDALQEERDMSESEQERRERERVEEIRREREREAERQRRIEEEKREGGGGLPGEPDVPWDDE